MKKITLALISIGCFLLITSCSSEPEEEYISDEDAYEPAGPDEDAPREEAEPLKLTAFEDTEFLDFLVGSSEGWDEAVMDGSSPIAASDDPEADLASFRAWKDGDVYMMQFDGGDERYIYHCVQEADGNVEIVGMTESEIMAGDQMAGFMYWMKKNSEDVVEVSFLDVWHARVQDSRLFGRHCELYICNDKVSEYAYLEEISMVEGLMGFHFLNESREKFFIGAHELDLEAMEGKLYNHLDDGSIFGKYEIIPVGMLEITTQVKSIPNPMEPSEYSEARVLLDVKIPE